MIKSEFIIKSDNTTMCKWSWHLHSSMQGFCLTEANLILEKKGPIFKMKATNYDEWTRGGKTTNQEEKEIACAFYCTFYHGGKEGFGLIKFEVKFPAPDNIKA